MLGLKPSSTGESYSRRPKACFKRLALVLRDGLSGPLRMRADRGGMASDTGSSRTIGEFYGAWVR
jgi:hypothetical protein